MNAKIEVHCPCGEPVRVTVERLGTQGQCPACKQSFLIWSSTVVKTAGDRHWFVQLEGRARGPVSFVELRRLVSEGRVERETLVRFGHDGAWMPAAQARGDVDVTVRSDPVRRARGRAARRMPPSRPRLNVDPQLLRLGRAGLAAVALLLLLLAIVRAEDEDAARKPLTTAEIVSRTLPSVALVRGRRGSGSGFVVAPGVLVTNYHVIEQELLRHVVIEFPNAQAVGHGFSAKLAYADEGADLAFLTIDGDVAPLPFAPTDEFRPGQEVLVVGSPGLGRGDVVLRNAVARGLLSTRIELQGQPYYQLDVSVNPGNSGGPVMDEQGLVLGVVAAKASAGEHLAFALPLAEVRGGLEHLAGLSERDVRRCGARHRMRVAVRAILPTAQVYYLAMVAYVRSLSGEEMEGPDEPLGAFLQEVDRHLLADLRLEEAEIRRDLALTATERDRFVRLWTTFAELKSAVDDPQGSLAEYTAQCEAIGVRLDALRRILLEADGR